MKEKVCIICGNLFNSIHGKNTCSEKCNKIKKVKIAQKAQLNKNPNKLLGIGSGNHPNNKNYDKSRSYRHYRKDYCEICGKQNCLLDLHHIDENHNNVKVSNFITLCRRCHKKHHTKRDSLGRFIKQAN